MGAATEARRAGRATPTQGLQQLGSAAPVIRLCDGASVLDCVDESSQRIIRQSLRREREREEEERHAETWP